MKFVRAGGDSTGSAGSLEAEIAGGWQAHTTEVAELHPSSSQHTVSTAYMYLFIDNLSPCPLASPKLDCSRIVF